MWVNNLPKVATQWDSGATRESNPGPWVRIPSALTTEPLSHVLSRKKLHHRNVLVITLPIIDRRSEFVHWHTICWRSRSWVIVKDPATPEICDRSLMFIVSLFLDVHATCLWLFTCRIYYATPASSLLDANVFRTAAVKDICHNVNVEYTLYEYIVSQKVPHFIVHIFAKYKPVFKILSLAHSVNNR